MNYQHFSEIFTASSATPSSSSEDAIIVSPGFETHSLLDSIYACPLNEIGLPAEANSERKMIAG
jgi:hypothetical protein